MIYLDNNATTKISSCVIERMHELMRMRLANPSSQHSDGRKARQVVEQARDTILESCGGRTVGMASDQLLFTSGGTEANNLAVLGLSASVPGAIVVSSIEHPSVLAAAEFAQSQGRIVHHLPVDQQSVVQLDALRSLLDLHRRGQKLALVSIMLANNETGVLQPVQEAAKMCREAGVLFHTDAVQVFGKLDLDFSALDVDAMTITAHKLHGPVGIGALVHRHGVQVTPQTYGGFQQLGIRPGTETAVLAGGFETAVQHSQPDLVSRASVIGAQRDSLQKGIQATIPDCFVPGDSRSRLPQTLSVAFPGVDRQALQLALDMAGIACSTGSACASGSSQASHVLEAMRLPAEIVKGAIRFSLSAETTQEEVDTVVTRLSEIVPKLRRVRNFPSHAIIP